MKDRVHGQSRLFSCPRKKMRSHTLKESHKSLACTQPPTMAEYLYHYYCCCCYCYYYYYYYCLTILPFPTPSTPPPPPPPTPIPPHTLTPQANRVSVLTLHTALVGRQDLHCMVGKHCIPHASNCHKRPPVLWVSTITRPDVSNYCNDPPVTATRRPHCRRTWLLLVLDNSKQERRRKKRKEKNARRSNGKWGHVVVGGGWGWVQYM